MLIRKTKFSEQVTLTITQKNVQNVYSNWTREDDRFVKHHTEDKWIEDEQSSPGYSKACGSKVGISHHDLKSSASTHGWLWRKGWRVGVMWIRTPLHGEVLTFLDWMLNCSLRVGEFSKMFLLFHPVPPTIPQNQQWNVRADHYTHPSWDSHSTPSITVPTMMYKASTFRLRSYKA